MPQPGGVASSDVGARLEKRRGKNCNGRSIASPYTLKVLGLLVKVTEGIFRVLITWVLITQKYHYYGKSTLSPRQGIHADRHAPTRISPGSNYVCCFETGSYAMTGIQSCASSLFCSAVFAPNRFRTLSPFARALNLSGNQPFVARNSATLLRCACYRGIACKPPPRHSLRGQKISLQTIGTKCAIDCISAKGVRNSGRDTRRHISNNQ